MDETHDDVGGPFEDYPSAEEDWKDHLEAQQDARAHFPHLAPHVEPRESDEYPTFWEGQ